MNFFIILCRKNVLGDLFSLVLSQFKKCHYSEDIKFNNLGIFQSLKLRNSMGKNLQISLKLNFTQNTLGCYVFFLFNKLFFYIFYHHYER